MRAIRRSLMAAIAHRAWPQQAPQSSSRRRRAREPAAALVESFDGLGVGFEGPQGKAEGRNPSDNGLAVGPDHIVQTVNSRLAVFTKKGKKFDTTGQGALRRRDHQHRLRRARRAVRRRATTATRSSATTSSRIAGW